MAYCLPRGQPAPRKQKEMEINTRLQFICCWRKLVWLSCRSLQISRALKTRREDRSVPGMKSCVQSSLSPGRAEESQDGSHSPIQPAADHWPHTHRPGKSKAALFCAKSGNSYAMWWCQRSRSLKNLYNWSRKVNHHQVRGNMLHGEHGHSRAGNSHNGTDTRRWSWRAPALSREGRHTVFWMFGYFSATEKTSTLRLKAL